MRELFDRTCPTAVFHAAAYKHVAMMERDVLSAVRANVLGSLTVAKLAGGATAPGSCSFRLTRRQTHAA